MRRYIIIAILTLIAFQGAFAQTDRDLIRQGNKLYGQHKYQQAEVAYRKAVAQNPNNSRALYNLGCALQKENRDSDAINQYQKAVKLEQNTTVRSRSYYNMGVAYQLKKDYGKAIEAYKDCLRLNPGDNDARYNYVLCKRMQNQQNQNSGSNQKNKDDKNKDKNDKNNKKNQQNKDNNKQQNKNNDQQQQQQNGEMSKENAEQLLQAAMNEENQTEAKLKKAMQQPSRRQLDKNW